MLLADRITAFAELGSFLSQFSSGEFEKKEGVLQNDLFFEAFKLQLKLSREDNGWFTNENITHAIDYWSKQLTVNNLNNWTSLYTFKDNAKLVAIIMAGNIPLVGFHDFLSVLLSGHKVLVKLSSNDKHLLPLIAKYLEKIEPAFKGSILFSDAKMEGFEAAIATGSNNTTRYFEAYFGKFPNIIRKNKNSVAVLTGEESAEDLKMLGEDIFRYFGLGCRSVSKIFVPRGYDFDIFFKAIYPYNDLIKYKKYQNNYDYNKAVYLMSEFKLLENGFLILKEDSSFSSPIASLFYEYYDSLDNLFSEFKNKKDEIQCIVAKELKNSVPFGQSHQPSLSDYADGVDTMAFLSSL